MGYIIAAIIIFCCLEAVLKSQPWLLGICYFGALLPIVSMIPDEQDAYFGAVMTVWLFFEIRCGRLFFQKRKRAAMREQRLALESIVHSPAVDALIDEAVEVVNDMLEIGYIVHILSPEEYNGLIHTMPNTVSFVPRLAGYTIVMGTVDLRSCRHRNPVYDQKPEWADRMAKLDRFIKKYSYCYNSQRHAYVYNTRKGIPVPSSLQEIPAGKIVDNERFLCEVKSRCPLADIPNSPSMRGAFYTKNISRG